MIAFRFFSEGIFYICAYIFSKPTIVKRFLVFFPVLLFASGLLGQRVLWATRVIDKSSEYGEKRYSAKQVLGKPNVLPNFRDSPCAWSPFREQSRTDEFIHVSFARPMKIRQVAVAESHNPGSVSKIVIYDRYDRGDTIYSNEMTRPLAERGRMLRVVVPQTPYPVASVKVILNTIGMPGWNHIDAIGISDSESPIEASINVVKDLTFDSQPQNLGPAVNSPFDEIMPIISPDGKTLYFDRKDHPQNTGGIVNDDIWRSELAGEASWSKAVNVGAPLNNKGHNFLTAISPDGNTALLGNVYEANGSMSSGLSIARANKEGWDFPKKLIIENYYNNNKFSEFHLGADGKTIVMTVQRMDSEGGKDLYVSFLRGDGTWTKPKNLGRRVNSAATEMSPFLAADGKTLYFSSDGFSGYGGKDMFMTRRKDNSWTNWTEPQNLGPMINSANWDAYYSVPASGEFAYFSSENNSLGKTDIFRIRLPQEMRPEPVVLVRGKVLDEKTKQPIAANIIYETLQDGKESGVARSNPKTGEYTIILPAGAKYGFLAQAEDYLSEHQNLDLTDIEEYKELNQDLLLVPIRLNETVVLNNIFFQPSKWALTPDSKPELERVYEFLKEHDNIRVEIGGHTNDACSEDWCKKLSTMRAKAVYNYLVKKGILANRIEFKGYGSNSPRYSNDNPDGRRKNRRVEFKIIGV